MALPSSPTIRLMTPRKLKVRWTEAAERKLIEAYHDVLEKYRDGGRWVTRKAKEEIVMKEVNDHVRNELHYESTYNYDEIHNKIDTMKKKAKIFAVRYQVKRPFGNGQLATGGETHLDADTIELNMDAAAMCWPNFRLYWERFKSYPSMWQPCREETHCSRDETIRRKVDAPATNDDGSDCELSYADNGEEPFTTSSHDHSPSTVASVCAAFRNEDVVECFDEQRHMRTSTETAEESDLPARTCASNSFRPAFGESHHVQCETRVFASDEHSEASVPRHIVVPRLIPHRHEASEQSARGHDRVEGYSEHGDRVVVHDWPARASRSGAPYSPHRRTDRVDDEDRHDRRTKRRPSTDGHAGVAAKRADRGEHLYSSAEYADSRDERQTSHIYSRAGEVYGQLGYVTATHYWPQEARSYPQARAGASERMEFMTAFQKLLEETQNRQFEHDQRLQIQWTEAQSRADRERHLFEQRMEQERRAFEQKAEQERRAYDERCERERDQLYSALQKENQESQAWIMQRITQFLAELSRKLFSDL